MDKEVQPHWISAYGVSIAIHLAVIFGVVGFTTQPPSVGGDGLISIDLVGNGGGDTGGQGQERKVSLPGDGGTNGDNRCRGPSVTSDSQDESSKAQTNSALKPSESKDTPHEKTSQDSPDSVSLLSSTKKASQKPPLKSEKTTQKEKATSSVNPDKNPLEKREQ